MTASQYQARFRVLGVILLLAGVGLGGFLYWRSLRSDGLSDDDVLRDQEQSRAYTLAVQKNVGSLGLLMSQWWDGLCSPQGIAVEVGLAGVLAAGGCFTLAARPPLDLR